MSIQGRWRIVELPGYEADYPDLVEPAYILFGPTGGEFAFGCVTGSFGGASQSDAMAFDWDGNDEMDEACGDGWTELQPDGSLVGDNQLPQRRRNPLHRSTLDHFFNSLLSHAAVSAAKLKIGADAMGEYGGSSLRRFGQKPLIAPGASNAPDG